MSQEETPKLTPSPCLVCGVKLDRAANDPYFDRIPYKGLLFNTKGHYGSTVFDPMDGSALEIVVCEDCITRLAGERVRLSELNSLSEPIHESWSKRKITPWNPEESINKKG